MNKSTTHSNVTATIHYKTVRINTVDVFYREAGPKDAHVVLLLHGFPTSSNMFRNLIPRLAASFHVIAPDYPGYGQSGMPERSSFAYTFENMTNVVEEFIEKLGVEKFSMYVMDYGAPIGYRLALRHPERIKGIIIQNGNAYEEGLKEFWDPIKKYWGDASPENRQALRFLTTSKATQWQYENGVSDTTLIDPTPWVLDQYGMDRPGNSDIQLDMLYDYRTNIPLYPQFQAFFRNYKPPTLITWGKNDAIFPADGATPYQRDLPEIETHLLDTGHFALETHCDEIANRIEEFLNRHFSSLRAVS
ncbi:unnamed protein product [Sphagnum tenellum]